MKIIIPLVLFSFGMMSVLKADDAAKANTVPQNPYCNYADFEKLVVDSAKEYEAHRLSEDQFISAMHEKGVVILDARSPKHFEELHVAGAVNLPFTEFSADALAKVIPRKDTKILIYCNNNFLGDREATLTRVAIPWFNGAASLTLPTYVTLKAFGFTNIYILGPLLHLQTTKIPFEGTRAARDTKR